MKGTTTRACAIGATALQHNSAQHKYCPVSGQYQVPPINRRLRPAGARFYKALTPMVPEIFMITYNTNNAVRKSLIDILPLHLLKHHCSIVERVKRIDFIG